ncbi:MAG: uncharacterized protein JWQ64_119 [Subtercola sp.]|nr:uncharacterized protein [Subtercola sp.]
MIGIIADDVTGGTDAASACRDGGLRTALSFGVPDIDSQVRDVDAHVIALKTRSVPARDAVAQTLNAAHALRREGAESFYFKYCSTFDSTADGNIGPVLDALAAMLDAETVVTTPAAPGHGRTVYRGYLFVGDRLLSESHMRDHPLTPMRDSFVPRLLAAQTRHPIASLDYGAVRSGEIALRRLLTGSNVAGTTYFVADAIDDADLATIASVIRNEKLTAGSAGLIGAIARDLATDSGGAAVRRLPTRSAVVAGSCSAATLAQIDAFKGAGLPWYELDILATPDPAVLADSALAWFDRLIPNEPALIYSSRPAEELSIVQRVLGVARSAEITERATADIAVGLAERGVKRIISAGGETSGAVVDALHLRTGIIGREAAAGVPWIHVDDDIAILLKSGNFGDRDLLVRAVTQETT